MFQINDSDDISYEIESLSIKQYADGLQINSLKIIITK